MKFIRDRADARFLPARYRFALFRLAAWIRLRGMAPQTRKGLAMAIDRDQTAIEHHVAGWGSLAVTTIYLASFFGRHMNMALGALLAMVLAPWVVQMPMFVVGGLLSAIGRGQTTSRVNSAATFALLFVASIHFASTSGLAASVGRAVLILIVANAIAAALLWVFRHRVAEAERRFAT